MVVCACALVGFVPVASRTLYSGLHRTYMASLIFQKVAFEYRIDTGFLDHATHFFVAFLPHVKQTTAAR